MTHFSHLPTWNVQSLTLKTTEATLMSLVQCTGAWNSCGLYLLSKQRTAKEEKWNRRDKWNKWKWDKYAFGKMKVQNLVYESPDPQRVSYVTEFLSMAPWINNNISKAEISTRGFINWSEVFVNYFLHRYRLLSLPKGTRRMKAAIDL